MNRWTSWIPALGCGKTMMFQWKVKLVIEQESCTKIVSYLWRWLFVEKSDMKKSDLLLFQIALFCAATPPSVQNVQSQQNQLFHILEFRNFPPIKWGISQPLAFSFPRGWCFVLCAFVTQPWGNKPKTIGIFTDPWMVKFSSKWR